MKRNTRLLLILLAATIVMIALWLPTQTTSIPSLQVSNESTDVRTPSDAVNKTESLEKMIAEIIGPGEWQTTEFDSNAPSIKIVSVLTNGEGCKTYVYDGDGKLLPNTESDSRDIDTDDNPFGTSDR